VSEYEQLVYSLAKPAESLLDDMSEKQIDVWHQATGVATEAGELLDAAKKYAIYNKPLDFENVIEELGDLEFYMERLRQILKITRTQVIDHNMAKLRKRYGSKYSDHAAQARADKV
jgi:NTP pyrophosphatase (non-canonical NTP hydrolase)